MEERAAEGEDPYGPSSSGSRGVMNSRGLLRSEITDGEAMSASDLESTNEASCEYVSCEC